MSYLVVLASGCGATSSKAAVIVDGILFSPRTIPIVKNDFDFELYSIDGQPIKRETVPFMTDAYAGAETAPGEHKIRILVYPIARPPNCVPKTIEIIATVESGKRYAIVGTETIPSLVEYHKQ